jgi:hypothetical protein
MNWRSRPLTSHEVIVSLIANTRTGLTVAAELDHGKYPRASRSPTVRCGTSSRAATSAAATGIPDGTTASAP